MMKTTSALCLTVIVLLAGCTATYEPATRDSGAPTVGSLRNAVVAVPMEGEPRPLTFLAGRLSNDELAELRDIAPNVHIVAGLSRAEALARAGEANGIDVRYCSAEFIEAAPNLRWVQAFSAGVDRYVQLDELVESDDIVLTNMKGIHGPAIADHCFAMLLSLTRELEFYREEQKHERWTRRPPGLAPTSLHGKTMLVVGLGGIGHQVAKRADGFGMRVLAITRSDKPVPDYVDSLQKSDALDSLLPESDVVCICLPLTDATRGMFDANRLALMREGAYLINIGRGPIVVTDALVAALESGQLGGACLDVTDPEPLPQGHPLWKAPNVVITPHMSAWAEVTSERRRDLFRENLRRFANGEPLLNVVDKKAGY